MIAKLGDMQTKNKAGKAMLSLPKGGRVMPPMAFNKIEGQYLAVASNEGRMLVFPLKDLPALAKGKGNKMIGIPSQAVVNREEYVVAFAIFTEEDQLQIHSGKRHLNLRLRDLEHYLGERGRRGHKLPRGLQKVDRIIVTSKKTGDLLDGDENEQ